MDKSALDKIKNIEQRFFEVEKLMSDPNNASDVQKITKLAKEHSELKKIVNLYQEINNKSSQLKDLQIIIKEEKMAITKDIIVDKNVILNPGRIK